MNPIYVQLGITLLLELALRRARKKEYANTVVAIRDILDEGEALEDGLAATDAGVRANIAECLADVIEDILKAVKQ